MHTSQKKEKKLKGKKQTRLPLVKKLRKEKYLLLLNSFMLKLIMMFKNKLQRTETLLNAFLVAETYLFICNYNSYGISIKTPIMHWSTWLFLEWLFLKSSFEIRIATKMKITFIKYNVYRFSFASTQMCIVLLFLNKR